MLNMIKKRLLSCHYHHRFFKTRRAVTTSTLPLDSSYATASSISTTDHKKLCLSLAEQLITRGLLSAAQRVIRRIISQSSSVSDAISAVDFVTAHGMDLDLTSSRILIDKLMKWGFLELAHSYYYDKLIGKGINPGSSVVNSMVICLCKLGRLDEARTLFDLLLRCKCCEKPAINALIRQLFAKQMFSDAYDYFVKMNDEGIHFGRWYYNVLIDGLCGKGYLQEAIKMFDLMHERTGMLPTLHLYKSLFYGFCKQGWLVEAECLFGEVESQGFFVDRSMYTSLINKYCKYRKMKMAMRIYIRMLKTGCEPDSYTYNTLIHGFLKMHLFDQGWMLCTQMMENGLQPSVQCYTALISYLYKENRLMEAETLFESMLNGGIVPDNVMFLALLKMYPKLHELHVAWTAVQAIAVKGCGLNLLALPFSATECLEQNIEFLIGEIVKRNLSLANVAFGILICALCVGGKSDIALSFVNTMLNLGCMPLRFTFNSLVKCLAEEGCFDDAKSVVDHMQDLDIFPDRTTCLIIINEHCKRGDWQSALNFLDQMENMGIKPGVAIYDCIIGSLCRQKRISEAQYLFKKMLESGVDVDEIVYGTIINGFSNNGRLNEACQLFEKMIEDGIKPNSYSYTVLISGLVKKDLTEKGCMYLERMLDDGLVPNAVLYTSLINNYLKKGDFEFAIRLVDLMKRNQIEPDLVSYIVLLSGFCRNIIGRKKQHFIKRESERAREMLFCLLHCRSVLPYVKKLRVSDDSTEAMKCCALKLVQIVKETRFMPNLHLYNGIISVICRVDRIQDAYGHFRLMEKDGIHPNQVTFTILMGGHIKAGEIDYAIDLFNKMNADYCPPDRIVYGTLIKGLCQAGRFDEALSLLHAMHKRGLIPCKATYDYLLAQFWADYLSFPAFKIFEEMLAYSFVPRQYSHTSCFLSYVYKVKSWKLI